MERYVEGKSHKDRHNKTVLMKEGSRSKFIPKD
jgi:hypothetical protein